MSERENYTDEDLYPSRHRLIGKVVSVAVGLIVLAILCVCPLGTFLFPPR